MLHETPALEALRKWLHDDPSRSQSLIARTLGIAQPSVSRWMSAFGRPTPEHRAALEALTGIPAADWQKPGERPAPTGQPSAAATNADGDRGAA